MTMAYTLTQVGKTNVVGNRKQKTYDLTATTAAYVVGGDTFTASQFGLKQFDFVLPTHASGGTAGATINFLYVIFNSAKTSFTLQVGESAATGLPAIEKTAEATVANFAAQLFVQGW